MCQQDSEHNANLHGGIAVEFAQNGLLNKLFHIEEIGNPTIDSLSKVPAGLGFVTIGSLSETKVYSFMCS